METEPEVGDVLFTYFLERARSVTLAHFRNQGGHGWGLDSQIAHAHSEVSEVYQAKRHEEGAARILEEICDSILACLTMAHIAGFSDEQVAAAMEETLQKTERRAGLRK